MFADIGRRGLADIGGGVSICRGVLADRRKGVSRYGERLLIDMGEGVSRYGKEC